MQQAPSDSTVRPFAVITGGGASAPSSPADVPVPQAELSSAEQGVWDHVVQALSQYGLVHTTDGVMLTVIVRTYVRWLEAERSLDEYMRAHKGEMIVESANGYRSPHPLYYVARNLRKDLLQWLPEACLTIPAFAKVKAASAGPQGHLPLDNPLAWHATAGRPAPPVAR